MITLIIDNMLDLHPGCVSVHQVKYMSYNLEQSSAIFSNLVCSNLVRSNLVCIYKFQSFNLKFKVQSLLLSMLN